MTATPDPVRRQLALAREKLLSTDGRNPLIHFTRPSKSLALTGPSGTDLAAQLPFEKSVIYANKLARTVPGSAKRQVDNSRSASYKLRHFIN